MRWAGEAASNSFHVSVRIGQPAEARQPPTWGAAAQAAARCSSACSAAERAAASSAASPRLAAASAASAAAAALLAGLAGDPACAGRCVCLLLFFVAFLK